MTYRLLLSRILIFVLFFSFSFSVSAAPSADAGKALFLNNCASCHAKSMKDKLTGPPLEKAMENWGGDKARIYAWIRNSQAMIAKGDPRAVAIWNEYKPTVMNNFQNFKDEEIESILLYIDKAAKGGGTTQVAGGATAKDANTEKEGGMNWTLFGILSVLSVLAYILSRLIRQLRQSNAIMRGTATAADLTTPETWTQFFGGKAAVVFLVFALIVLGGYTTVNNAISLGRQQGYAPTQPIKFSHATHAGMQKIDCQYCHDSARRSKHSSIPGTNTCMNCHAAIKKGSKYGTGELTKIYASIGFDPMTSKYIDGYENLSNEEVAGIYKKWIKSQYLEDNKIANENASTAQSFSDHQWAEIEKSLTNETKPKVQGPIEWTRIHNLPDHAYFNHSQHVTVGKVECQTCHGQVQTMETLQQHAPLSMGWCINCHRETEVTAFKDNEYYKSYERYHKELKDGTREKVTVEDIGGLECQKCHY
jgi:mono/diheme cytochrome c family protein